MVKSVWQVCVEEAGDSDGKIGIEPKTTFMARKGRSSLLNILGQIHEGGIRQELFK